MSQFGMQMPGGRGRQAPSMDVFTGLMFLAVLVLLLACVVLWIQGGKIGPDGNPMGMHEENKSVKLVEAK